MGSLETFRSEVRDWLADIAMQILGSRGLGWSGDGFEGAELARTRRWLITRADSIWGGTSEIQRNIIAKRVLLIPE